MSARSLSTQHQQVIRYTVQYSSKKTVLVQYKYDESLQKNEQIQRTGTRTMSTRTCSRYKFRTRTVLYCTYSLVRVRVQDLEDLKLLCLLVRVLYSYCTRRTCRPTAYSANLSLQSRREPTHPPFTGLYYTNTRPDTSKVRAGHVTPAWQGLNNPEPIILRFIILIPIS